MENLHVKFEFDEALASKKGILNSQVSFINIEKKIQAYKKIRKEEVQKKVELKSRLVEIANKMNNLRKVLPSAKLPQLEEKSLEETALNSIRHEDLEMELKTIKEKLAKLD